MNLDEKFIERCFDLALCGMGNVSPNPMVGCVICHNDKIISEGFHRQYGLWHAEVNAIDAAISSGNGDLLKDSTLYVNLEPCSHYGKTPPCAKKILDNGIKKVVFANFDPNPKVDKKGANLLRQNGVEVVDSVLKDKGWFLNRRFFTRFTKHRPYIILKWAASVDGYIAGLAAEPSGVGGGGVGGSLDAQETGGRGEVLTATNVSEGAGGSQTPVRTQISDYRLSVESHKMRAGEDAILLGTNSILIDNPKLDTRDYFGKSPLRVVLDFNSRLRQRASDLKIFGGGAAARAGGGGAAGQTLVFVSKDCKPQDLQAYSKSAKVVPIEKNWEAIFAYLADIQINSIIVEGGKKLLDDLISKGLYDEIRLYSSDIKLGRGYPAPILPSGLFKYKEDLVYGSSKTYPRAQKIEYFAKKWI